MAIFHLAAAYGSTDPLRRTARLTPRIWTAPAKAERGDLAVLYSTTAREWMAIGRIVHKPVRSRRDQRWWSYIQWFPVGVHLPTTRRADMRSSQAGRSSGT